MNSSASWAIRAVLLIQLGTTLAMTGLIWFVQIVHYPLFSMVGTDGFARYEAMHATRTGWVVGPLMLAELLTSLLMLWPAMRIEAVPAWSAWSGAVLVACIWLSTGLIQVPLHSQLAAGSDGAAVERLVATNWIRTMAWTMRAGLVLGWTARGLLPGPH